MPIRDILTDVRTQMGVLIVAVNALSASWQASEQRQAEESARVTAAEVVALRADLTLMRARQDSVNRTLRVVEAMAQVYCLKERDPLARRILECDR